MQISLIQSVYLFALKFIWSTDIHTCIAMVYWPSHSIAIDHSSIGLKRLTIQLVFNEAWLCVLVRFLHHNMSQVRTATLSYSRINRTWLHKDPKVSVLQADKPLFWGLIWFIHKVKGTSWLYPFWHDLQYLFIKLLRDDYFEVWHSNWLSVLKLLSNEPQNWAWLGSIQPEWVGLSHKPTHNFFRLSQQNNHCYVRLRFHTFKKITKHFLLLNKWSCLSFRLFRWCWYSLVWGNNATIVMLNWGTIPLRKYFSKLLISQMSFISFICAILIFCSKWRDFRPIR